MAPVELCWLGPAGRGTAARVRGGFALAPSPRLAVLVNRLAWSVLRRPLLGLGVGLRLRLRPIPFPDCSCRPLTTPPATHRRGANPDTVLPVSTADGFANKQLVVLTERALAVWSR